MALDVGVVIPAAGEGARLKRATRKAFVPLAGRPLVWHALRVFQAVPSVRWIVVAVHPDDRRRMQQLAQRARLTKLSAVVAGGASRTESVARGIAALPEAARWVVVHDGARPCVTAAVVTRVIGAARRYGAVASGLPMDITVKAVDQTHQVRLTLDRDSLWAVHTPQAFRRDWFVEAWRRASGGGESFPDDVSLLEWAGYPVRMVPGDARNLKVTTPDDLLLAQALLGNGHAHRHRI